jgi:hypothetical protein
MKTRLQTTAFQHFTLALSGFYTTPCLAKVFHKPKILFCWMGLSCNLAKEFNGLVSKRAGCVYTRLFFWASGTIWCLLYAYFCDQAVHYQSITQIANVK